MCGIAGWVEQDGYLLSEKSTLEDMVTCLTHRGPDAEGYWIAPHVALGHRRLVVVDPEGGGQPMVRRREGRAYVMVYNGELYNTGEIRRELQNRGVVFTSYSDTEALLLAYMEWGAQCLERLNGIYAFAIWDEKDESLFMARDRLGVKPLFYTQVGGRFIFGSEIKALLAHPAVKPQLDGEGLAELFLMGPGRRPGSGVIKGVSELLPGQYMRITREREEIGRYWGLESAPHRDDLPTTVARVRELLADAVKRQLISDVPLCTLLSGGLDSSALTALAAQDVESLKTFSVEYVGNENNFQANAFQKSRDEPWAHKVAEQLQTEHRDVYISTEALVGSLTVAMRARDLPGMVDIDGSLYLFSREIKREATVALSGECADEVFGGYPWLYREDALGAATFPWSLGREVWMDLLTPEIREKMPRDFLRDTYYQALSQVPGLQGETEQAARVRQISYLNLFWWMPTLLDRKDRMSMATGLEIRVPFCDHHLVEYAWNIPWEMKNLGGIEKGILRKALSGLLPDDVLYRKKSPYPKTFDPGYLQALTRWMGEILQDPGSPLHSLIDKDVLKGLMSQGEMERPWFGQLMRLPQLLGYLIQVDLWMREYRIALI